MDTPVSHSRGDTRAVCPAAQSRVHAAESCDAVVKIYLYESKIFAVTVFAGTPELGLGVTCHEERGSGS